MMKPVRLLIAVVGFLSLMPSARALTILELARLERPQLLGYVNGSIAGAISGLALVGNRNAAECVRLWGTASASGDSKASTDILTRFGDELEKLRPGARAPEYELVLGAAIRKQCSAQLPSAN